MKKTEVLKKLSLHPLITFNDFIKLTGLDKKYAWIYILRLKNEGLIFQIEKGKYSIHSNPLIFSSYIIIPSYISFWTALQWYNLTEQLPLDIMIASPKSKESFTFQKTKIAFFKLKDFWGYKKVRYDNFDIFIAEKEKCIIDCFLAENTPFGEILKAIKTKDFDLNKMVVYVLRTGNSSLTKRMGCILEILGFDNQILDKLVKNIDYNYVLLDFRGRKKGKKNKKWKVIINTKIEEE